MNFRAGHPTGLQFEFSLEGVAHVARADSKTFGRLAAWLGEDLAWGRLEPGTCVTGIQWYWIELLEHLASNWRYLRYEQGYPFGVMPVRPSGLVLEMQRRWSQPRIDEAAEDELLYAFRSSHNLAWALNGCVVPDVWFVREGQVVLIESKGRVRRCPRNRELHTLEDLGEHLCALISQLDDPRSVEARLAWQQRNDVSFEEALLLLTAESPERLAELTDERYQEAFEDPLATALEDNRAIDLVYRCKGLAPVQTMRHLLSLIPRETAEPNAFLEDLSRQLRQELDSLVENDHPPYAQGKKLALKLRHDADLFPDRCGRADPENLLAELGVTVERQPLDALSLDAVAVWGQGAKPRIVVNVNEKHAANIGAERATMTHELCHLLVDRQDVLPLTAVVGGAMDRSAEQRANAFAAEFLCPRFCLRQMFDQAMSADVVISQATQHFSVSRELAALQLARAECQFSISDQRHIESCVSLDASLPWRSS